MGTNEGVIIGKIVVSHIETKVGVSNSGTRHVNGINDLLEKMRREVFIGVDVVNGESVRVTADDGGKR